MQRNRTAREAAIREKLVHGVSDKSRRVSQSRFMAAILLCVVAALVLAACGGTSKSTAAAKTSRVTVSGKSDVPITLFGANPNGNGAGITDIAKGNWLTNYLERKFNVTLSFDLAPGSSLSTKESLLLASGSYPPVIWDGTFSHAEIEKYSSEGILVPLNKLIAEYAPNVEKALKTVPGYKQYVTSPNGEIYSLPAYNYCYHCNWPWLMYINIKYLNEFGLQMPRTTSQFEHVLEVFKAHGLVPLSGANTKHAYDSSPIPYLMNAFVPWNGDSYHFADVNPTTHQVYFVADTAGWKKGLEYIYGLYQKGLFSKTVFTQLPTEVEDLIAKNQVGSFPNGANETITLNYGSKGSHYLDWLAMPPLKGPSGAEYAAFSQPLGPGAFTFAITNKATPAQEQRIMEIVNFLFTPVGAQIQTFGPEGKFWKPAPKGVDGLIPQQALFLTNYSAFTSGNAETNDSWYQWGPEYRSAAWRNLDASAPPFAPNGSQTKDQLNALEYAGQQAKWQLPNDGALWVPQADAETFATELTNIDNYVTEWTDDFVTGEKSISADWGAYVKGLDNLGLGQYMKILREAVSRSGGPVDTYVPAYEPIPGDMHYLLTMGSVPALTKKYLIESGVPSKDFVKS
jgi:putative aldouronate transport system substrate-binding protein